MIISSDSEARQDMRNDMYSRIDLAERAAGKAARRPSPRGVVAAALLMLLAARTPVFAARDQKSVQPQGTPPDLQITQVKPLAASGSALTTDVEIRWIAQVPRLTSIEGFDVVLEARYSDGSKSAPRNEQLKSSARSAILQLATHPKQNSNATLKDFKVSVKAKFKIASSLTVVQQVTAAQGDSFRSSAGSSSSSQPEVFITAAKLVAQGCAPGQRCVDVKWTAVAPRNITINEFIVSIEALRKNGTRSTDSKTAGGADRQARLSTGPDDSEINSIKVSLVTNFSSLDFKTVVKEGTLAQAFSKSDSYEVGRLSQRAREEASLRKQSVNPRSRFQPFISIAAHSICQMRSGETPRRLQPRSGSAGGKIFGFNEITFAD
jgi:hypothetical protein